MKLDPMYPVICNSACSDVLLMNSHLRLYGLINKMFVFQFFYVEIWSTSIDMALWAPSRSYDKADPCCWSSPPWPPSCRWGTPCCTCLCRDWCRDHHGWHTFQRLGVAHWKMHPERTFCKCIFLTIIFHLHHLWERLHVKDIFTKAISN